MRCKECGFRVKGKRHSEGEHHRNLFRRFGIIPINPEMGKALPRVEMRKGKDDV